MLTARRRNLALAVYSSTKPTYKSDQDFTNRENTFVVDTLSGQYPYFYNGTFFPTLTCETACNCQPEPSANTNCLMSPIVLMGLDSVLNLCATGANGRLGPTKVSFILYVYWFGVATGFNQMLGGPISGSKDNWNWSNRTLLSETREQFVFLNAVLRTVLPTIFANVIPGFAKSSAFGVTQTYDTTALLNYAYSTVNLTASEYNAFEADVLSRGNFAGWSSAFQTWYGVRNPLAITIAASSFTTANMPNGSHYIVASNGLIDPVSGFPNPTKWTPITLPSGANQSYYTFQWHTVPSASAFTNADISYIKGNANTYSYPDTAPGTTSAERDADIDAMMGMTSSLTDTQKSIAEFWAGITNTVSPPGMSMWFWKKYIETYNIGTRQNTTSFIYSGFHLALGLFEGGRLCWELKYDHLQDRPIQEVRRRYAGSNVPSWNGTVLGDNWVPYQPSTFVTPPFADFPSGHSVFSRVMASVMTAWFGSNFPEERPTQNLADLNLMSPAYTYGTTAPQPFGTIVFPAGQSHVESGVPATDQTLTWNSWLEMADQAGLSRQCGGIHPLGAHLGSVSLVNSMFPIMSSNWGLPY